MFSLQQQTDQSDAEFLFTDNKLTNQMLCFIYSNQLTNQMLGFDLQQQTGQSDAGFGLH